MRLRNKILLTLLIIALPVTASSCWDRRELEDLGIVLAIGVETVSGNRVKVTVQTVVPAALTQGMPASGGGGGGSGGGIMPYRNRAAEADTIFEAVREISRQSPRQLFFAHNQIIIFSEELARTRGVKEFLDFFERNPETRRTSWVIVTGEEISRLLEEPGRLEPIPAGRIVRIIEGRELNSRYQILRLGEFVSLLESDGIQPSTAILEIEPNLARPRDQQSIPAQAEIQPQFLALNGTALFLRGKMVGRMNTRTSRGLLFLKGDARGGIVDVVYPGDGGQRDTKVSLEIIRNRTKVEPEIRDGAIYMNVHIKLDCNLGESMGRLDLTHHDVILKLEDEVSGVLRSEMEDALIQAQQECRADVFGFGDAVHRKYPREWKQMSGNWSDIFPTVQVQFEVDTKIRRTGLINNPVESDKH